MSAVSFRLAVATTVLATLFPRSATAANPPLEQLGLRDTLLAKPEVVAALWPTAHQQLAQRFEEARRHPGAPQELLVAPELGPVEVIRTLDRGRLARGHEALIAGQVHLTPLGIEVPFFTDEPTDVPDALPPLEGVPAGSTAADEERALHGTAGAVLQGLLLQSQATRLVRVVSWPVAAVAIQDVVYVNAAWLIIMGPQSENNTNPPLKSAGIPNQAGCGGAVVESSQGSLPTRDVSTYTSEPEKAAAAPGTAASPSRAGVEPPLRGGEETHSQNDPPQYLWTGGTGAGTAGSAESRTTAAGLPIGTLTYSLDSSADSSGDCCRYTSSSGCNTQAPCKSSSSSCSSGGGSGCRSGSGSGCNSGSGSGCNSGSGSGCNSGGSSCGSSGGSGSKCSIIVQRPSGEIPDAATLAFLLAPLAFLMLQERRWRR